MTAEVSSQRENFDSIDAKENQSLQAIKQEISELVDANGTNDSIDFSDIIKEELENIDSDDALKIIRYIDELLGNYDDSDPIKTQLIQLEGILQPMADCYQSTLEMNTSGEEKITLNAEEVDLLTNNDYGILQKIQYIQSLQENLLTKIGDKYDLTTIKNNLTNIQNALNNTEITKSSFDSIYDFLKGEYNFSSDSHQILVLINRENKQFDPNSDNNADKLKYLYYHLNLTQTHLEGLSQSLSNIGDIDAELNKRDLAMGLLMNGNFERIDDNATQQIIEYIQETSTDEIDYTNQNQPKLKILNTYWKQLYYNGRVNNNLINIANAIEENYANEIKLVNDFTQNFLKNNKDIRDTNAIQEYITEQNLSVNVQTLRNMYLNFITNVGIKQTIITEYYRTNLEKDTTDIHKTFHDNYPDIKETEESISKFLGFEKLNQLSDLTSEDIANIKSYVEATSGITAAAGSFKENILKFYNDKIKHFKGKFRHQNDRDNLIIIRDTIINRKKGYGNDIVEEELNVLKDMSYEDLCRYDRNNYKEGSDCIFTQDDVDHYKGQRKQEEQGNNLTTTIEAWNRENKGIVAIITELGIQDWDGSSDKITKNNEKISNYCTEHNINPDDFVAKLKEMNEARIGNNKEQLKAFPIISVLGDKMENISKNNEGQLVFKRQNGDTPTETDLTIGTMVDLLGLEEKAKDQLRTTPGTTKFVNDAELIEMINADEEIRQARLNKITEAVQQREDEELENSLLSLENPDDINVHLFNVEADAIISAINSAKDNIPAETKEQYIAKIKAVVDALKNPGRSINGRGSESIKTLQDNMQKELELKPVLVPDGKFGPRTLYAMRKYLGAEISRQDNLTYEVNINRLTEGQKEILKVIDDKEALSNLGITIQDGENIQDIAESYIKDPRKYLGFILLDKSLKIPGKQKIQDIVTNRSEKQLRYFQLALLPKYTGSIDGKFGRKTLSAAENYIKNKNRTADDKESSDIKPLLQETKGSTKGFERGNEHSFIKINCDDDNCTNNKVYFFDGSVFDYGENEYNKVTGTIEGQFTYPDGTVSGQIKFNNTSGCTETIFNEGTVNSTKSKGSESQEYKNLNNFINKI